ncbi:hypothetical protein EG328_004715 [Venturia inaequalis]|uniref:Uncharacterized protein n=1 Tax=Venturia inaequalis TaxID=5025 RepID=A0A8H3UP08_VENIN|nr:hypothetical protein EG328_004715 [Venturia inaequalis]RDI87248.1 hypothetical protein Vi05172_g2979 [Venturia inaequalis]
MPRRKNKNTTKGFTGKKRSRYDTRIIPPTSPLLSLPPEIRQQILVHMFHLLMTTSSFACKNGDETMPILHSELKNIWDILENDDVERDILIIRYFFMRTCLWFKAVFREIEGDVEYVWKNLVGKPFRAFTFKDRVDFAVVCRLSRGEGTVPVEMGLWDRVEW